MKKTELKSLTAFENASVKVMRSFDYCHFEVALSSSTAMTPEAVDNLRKDAMRLADKAVEQYKVAKKSAERRQELEGYSFALERIRKTPEKERTPKEQAALKYADDQAFLSKFDYDYEDDYEQQ